LGFRHVNVVAMPLLKLGGFSPDYR
jgi:hypothetical protein